jgi:hypothetical protein
MRGILQVFKVEGREQRVSESKTGERIKPEKIRAGKRRKTAYNSKNGKRKHISQFAHYAKTSNSIGKDALCR